MSMFKGSVYGKDLPKTATDLLVVLGSSDVEINLEACGRFASVYFDPLVGYLLRSKKFFGNREEAKDLVSDFIFKRLIEKRIVEGFKPSYGGKKRKFRHYLCRSLLWLYQEKRKKKLPDQGLLSEDQIYSEPDAHDLDANVYEYVLAANLLLQAFLAVKTDCINKKQYDMWEVFVTRVIKQALTGKKEKHVDIAERLGLENAKRSSHLLESGLQKFKSFANRIIKEVEPGLDRRSPEELLKTLVKPPISNFNLCEHLEKLIELSAESDKDFLIETGTKLKAAAESWLNDREVEPRDENEQRWAGILYQTVDHYQSTGQATESTQLSVSRIVSSAGETMADVLFQPTFEINALEDIRRASRRAITENTPSRLTPMHRTVYALVHASDIVHHRACVSKSAPQSLLKRFESCLAKPWLDEQSRWQLETAAELLRDEQIPFSRSASQT